MEENVQGDKQELAPEIAKSDKMRETYIKRQDLLKAEFPNIFDLSETPKSIMDEYMALNTMIDSLKTAHREIWGKKISSDGCAIDSFVSKKYEEALAEFSKLNKENEQYIKPEEQINAEPEEQINAEPEEQVNTESAEQTQNPVEEAKLKRDEMIDKCVRRQGAIAQKFPNLFKESEPLSVLHEYMALNSIIDSLRYSSPELGEDGSLKVDIHVAKKYNDALARSSELNKENEQYITHEEEENFQFPEIDFEGLNQEMQELQTVEECLAFKRRVQKMQTELHVPQATYAELREVLSQSSGVLKGIVENNKTNERTEDSVPQNEKSENSAPALVGESKFAKIYQEAKGRIQKVFQNIKNFFKGKSQDKNNDEQDFHDDK